MMLDGWQRECLGLDKPMRTATDEERKGVTDYIHSISQRIYTTDEVIDMFTKIQLEIEAHKMTSGVTNQGTWNECVASMSRVVQERINALRGEKDETDKSNK